MDEKLLELAKAEGFLAAVIPAKDVPVDGKFRVYCEENRCGQYGANYSCPPDCGTVEELKNRIEEYEYALVLSTNWEINGYEDKETVNYCRKTHNDGVRHLLDTVRKAGYRAFCTGYGGCRLCTPCLRTMNLPCAHPDKRISCMSAYCVDVGKLAQRCNLAFDWDPTKLFLFGMICCTKEPGGAQE